MQTKSTSTDEEIKNIKDVRKIIWKAGIFGSILLNFICVIPTFYIALYCGGKVLITINSGGEMWVEALIVFPGIILFLLWTLLNTKRY
jgi:hypothetical protein